MNTLFIKKSFLISATAVLLFSSCATKENNHGQFNDEFKKFTDKNIKKLETKDYLKSSIKEIINNKKIIDLDNSQKISSVLTELSNIDGESYLLSSDSEDFFVQSIKNSHKLGIDSFSSLNQYIQDTSNYFIYVKKNKFLKNRVKIVSVKNQEVYEKNLKNIPFTVEGRASVSFLIEQLKDVSGFNVIAKDIPQSDEKASSVSSGDILFKNNSIDKLFNNTYISFSGNNISELLEYLSSSFNIYIDIDYDHKTIIFSKIKSRLFSISLNNVQYSGSLDVKKDVQNDVGASGGAKNAIKTKIKLDILDSLEKTLQAILDGKSTDGSLLSFNRTVGTIFIKADKETMKDMSIIISNFNKTFEKQIDFKLEVYEFAVTKEFNAGISLGSTITSGALAGNIATKSISNSIFTSSATSSSTTKMTGLSFDNTMIRLIKQTRHGYILKNGIPYFMDITNSKTYIKGLNSKTTTTNGITQTSFTPETSDINEGTVLSVLGKVTGNKIDFNIQPKIIKLNGISTATFDGNTISLPDLSVSTFTSNIILNNGERKVIGYLTSYDDVNDYNGVVPIENFIIGGAKSKKYYRKETVYVISANLRE